MTLTEFLLACIAVEEGKARAALGLLGMETEWHRVEWLRERGLTIADAQHITTHSPRRVLAECEAKRRIVALFPDPADGDGWNEASEQVLEHLALPYADHPDYQPEHHARLVSRP